MKLNFLAMIYVSMSSSSPRVSALSSSGTSNPESKSTPPTSDYIDIDMKSDVEVEKSAVSHKVEVKRKMLVIDSDDEIQLNGHRCSAPSSDARLSSPADRGEY